MALGPQVSFHSEQATNDEMYPLDDGFFGGVNCQPDLLQRFLGEDCSIAALLSAKKPKRWHVLLLLIEAQSGPVAAIFEQFVEASI